MNIFPAVYKHYWLWIGCWVLLMLFIPKAVGFSGQNALNKISFSSQPGNRVQITLDFATQPQMPLSFATDNPARIVLDFPNVKLSVDKKSQVVGIGAVQSTRAVEANNRTRLVLALVRSVPFEINLVGNKAYIIVENIVGQGAFVSAEDPLTTSAIQANQQRAAAPPIAPSTSELTPAYYAPEPETIRGNAVTEVDFRRTEEEAGRVIITLSSPDIVVSMTETGNDINLTFNDARLPRQLDRRLDVVDFATPISFIDTYQEGRAVQMKITTRGDYEHLAYQSGNVYVVEVKEAVEIPEEEITIEEKTYEGQKVSFNFQDIDVRAALLLLTDLPGLNYNMVISDQVEGSMTLRLKNTPWDQALDIIMEARGLGMKQVGNVIMVDLKENLTKREQEQLRAQKEIEELEPLRTEYVQINYAKASDLVELIRSRSTSAEQGHSFLSERGNISHDERTNTLILQDTKDKLDEIRQLISSLDTPVRQVLIESKVVVATDDFSRDLGVKFGYSAQDVFDDYFGVIGGKVEGDTTFPGGTGFISGEGGGGGGAGDGVVENFLVSLPSQGIDGATAASAGLAIGRIGSILLQLELSALQAEGRGEVVSSPRVITANQKEATILQGQEIPYVGIAAVGAAAQVQFREALLELKVTPQITPDDRVIMDLAVKKDTGVPVSGDVRIDRREVRTQVLVDNGETVVLGGVYERTRNDSVERVPFFSDLPLIGNLFKRQTKEDNKSELLIFVTPKILKQTS